MAPLTLKVTLAPEHIVPEGEEFMVRVGSGTTLTVVTALPIQ